MAFDSSQRYILAVILRASSPTQCRAAGDEDGSPSSKVSSSSADCGKGLFHLLLLYESLELLLAFFPFLALAFPDSFFPPFVPSLPNVNGSLLLAAHPASA